jgi:hypothetical protein
MKIHAPLRNVTIKRSAQLEQKFCLFDVINFEALLLQLEYGETLKFEANIY